MLDLFGVGGNPAQGFGDKVFEALDDTRVEQRANVAATIAQQAAKNLKTWAPCQPPATGSATACEQQIVDTVGNLAYRHPLSSSERSELLTLFDAGIAEKDFATGVEWFLTGLLQSPDFSYEVVRPATEETPGEVRALGPYEYATRMALFIWDGPPDAALLSAAPGLGDATTRDAQLARMLQDPKFARGVEQFYSRWLNIPAFAEVARDPAGFDQNVVSALAQSLLMSATELYKTEAPNFTSLFAGESYYMNDALRQFYGLGAGSADFAPTTLPGEGRRGILTHPGLMALLARPEESNPIARGLFVLRKVLCTDVSPPPQGVVIPQLAPIADGLSTRERLEAHTTEPLCASCHATIDPPGFALEAFDEVGRFRTMDHGVQVDSSGDVEIGADVDGAFTLGDQFLAKLAESAEVRQCFARNYLNFALSLTRSDPAIECSVSALGSEFSASGDLKALVLSVARSDALAMRTAEGVGQ